jgi:hypothetical protein
VQFDHICNARDAEAERPQAKTPKNLQIPPRLTLAAIDLVMEHTPLGGDNVFKPHLFEVDQRAPPRTVNILAHGGKRQKLVFGVHDGVR